ncbi:MAG: hypothetical protein IPF99_42670 [Deltaproteobacteria bacterium]|nr:hypothetical protein [Deltaproteobacteria bacterium]
MAMRFVSVVPRHALSKASATTAFGPEPGGRRALPALERWEGPTRIVMRQLRYWNALASTSQAHRGRAFWWRGTSSYHALPAGEIDYAHNYSLGTADYLWLLNNRAWRPHGSQPGTLVGGLMMKHRDAALRQRARASRGDLRAATVTPPRGRATTASR